MSGQALHENPTSGSTPYEPPTIVRLGTLAELTQGGLVSLDDGMGGAGDEGSI